MGRYDEALESLDEAIRDRPDLITAHEEKGESLWQLGRKEEAVAAWGLVTKQNAGLPLALNMLSGASRSLGRTDVAAEYEQQADRATPPDPFFHYMVGIRLENIGMGALAEKHYRRAAVLDPKFGARRDLDLLDRYGKRPQYQR
jgi:superkiller protein 3